MERKICNSCGGALNREGAYYVCPFCGNRWIAEVSDNVNAVARANAWEALRKSDFDKATELFEEIVLKDKTDYESFWGLALAKASIVYVVDLEKDQKVPTLNNISEESFILDRAVTTAISLAPKEVADEYRRQAEYVEKVRKEWLEKASKEPPYDVFICFKDSDRERGIERTQDSYDVQDLYTSLISKGYKVFFSRETLRSKIADEYEPYIYNAIKTAKIMIVFGEKAEYFSSPWLKNEWMRFKKRVEKGEKHKNALVTLFKGVNPYDIPTALTGGKQAIDYSIPSNFELLMNHVKLVVNESKQAKKLDKIEIKGGQMGKKSAEIKQETLKTREIGSSAVETSITDKQTLNLALAYVSAGEFAEAEKMLAGLMIESPNNAEFKWHYLKIKYRTDEKGLMAKLPNFADDDVTLLKNIVSTADKALATQVLNFLYDSQNAMTESKFLEILDFVLPFNYENRLNKLSVAFERAITNSQFKVFQKLLPTLQSGSVDEYLDYLTRFAQKTAVTAQKEWCVNAVLASDEGNLWAIEYLYKKALKDGNLQKAIEHFEQLLKFSPSVDEQVERALKEVSLNGQTECDFVRQILRYYDKDLAEIAQILSKIAMTAIKNRLFDFAKDLCEVVIDKTPTVAEPYWALCLATLKATAESAVIESDVPLNDLPEFKKYLTLVDTQRQIACIKLAKQQEGAILKRKQVKEAEERKAKAQAEAEKLRKQAEERKAKITKITIAVLASVTAVIVAFCLILNTVIIPNNKYNTALSLMEDGKYEQAISVFKELGSFSDSQVKIVECNTAILDGKYNQAVSLMQNGEYEQALNIFEELNNYKDSQAKFNECNTAILDGKYAQAVSLMQNGEYERAISVFESLDSYKDSQAKIDECNTAILDGKYNNAISLMEDGKYAQARPIFESLDGYKDSAEKINQILAKCPLLNVSVGDYIKFGKYEQDNNADNGKEQIEWLVLDVVDDRALVISEYVLDRKPYHTTTTNITWETCSLRSWLNNDFLNSAFTNAEKEFIPTVLVTADKHPQYTMNNPGNDVNDKIFLLSITQMNKYLSSNTDKHGWTSDYAIAQGLSTSGIGSCKWWLRTASNGYVNATFVEWDGTYSGTSVGYQYCGVRPAMWIDLYATTSDYTDNY